MCYQRHILQHHAEAEDAFLHGELDHTVRGHLVPIGAHVLYSGGLGRESSSVHHHTAVADNVLPAHVGNYTFNIAGSTTSRQVSALHHVSGGTFRAHHDRHIERALPKTFDA